MHFIQCLIFSRTLDFLNLKVRITYYLIYKCRVNFKYHIIIDACSKDVALAAEANHLWFEEDAKQ